MDKEKFLLRLSLEADTLKAHINRLKPTGYTVHPLDMELLRKKAMDLYDLMLEFEMSSTKSTDIQKEPIEFTIKKPEPQPVAPTSPPEPVVPAQTAPLAEEPAVPEPEKPLADDVTLTHEPDSAPEIPLEIAEEPETKPPTPIQQETPPPPAENTEVDTPLEVADEPPVPIPPKDVMPEKKEAELPPAQQPKAHKPAPVKTTLDLFSTVAESVGTRTMAESDNSVAGRIQKERLQNIRSAIGINEKFLFLNELFKGDLARYNRVIDELNAMQTKQGADTYLMELKIEGQLGENHPAFEKLKEIVGRKY